MVQRFGVLRTFKLLRKIYLNFNFCKRILQQLHLWFIEELGRYPLDIKIKTRMISFWSRLQNNVKLNSSLYKLVFCLKPKSHYTYKWWNYVESIFNDTGIGYIFANPFLFMTKIKSNKLYITNLFKNGLLTLRLHPVLNFILCSKKILELKINYLTTLPDTARNIDILVKLT